MERAEITIKNNEVNVKLDIRDVFNGSTLMAKAYKLYIYLNGYITYKQFIKQLKQQEND